MISVHEAPLGHLALPEAAKSIVGETFHCLLLPDRFERGDVAVVCHCESTVMGYVWISFRDLWVCEGRLFLSLAADEATTYDAFVFPQYRGRGLYARFESAALAESGRRGRKRVITIVESDNTNSLKTQLRLGKIEVMRVYSIHLFDRFSLHWATGRPLASRFHR
jgi:GNAT superfamily N-acetyltransferase